MAGGTPVQGPPTAYSVQRIHADERGEHIEDVVQAADPLALDRVEPGDAEDGGGVNGNTGDADPLLQDLQPDHELHTAAGVELSRADSKQHVNVGVLLGLLGLERDDLPDVLVLGLGARGIGPGGPSQPLQDIPGFLVAPYFDKPSGRLGEEPDARQQDEEWDDLESDREPPPDGRIAVVDVG